MAFNKVGIRDKGRKIRYGLVSTDKEAPDIEEILKDEFFTHYSLKKIASIELLWVGSIQELICHIECLFAKLCLKAPICSGG